MTIKELSHYKMTQIELDIWKSFCDEVRLSCIKMGIHDTTIIESYLKENAYYQYTRGYHSSIGFYEILFGDRGELSQSLQTQSTSDCLWHYLLGIASKVARDIELNQREEHKGSWKYRVDYDGRLCKFYYTIQFLRKLYSNTNYLDEYIKHCTDLMNLIFEVEHWKYDTTSNEFLEL